MHLFMVTLDSLLTVQMARCTASRVDDYKGIKYLGFSPARPILKPFQRALTNIKLDGQTLAPNDQIELRKQLHRNRTATVDAANAEAAAIHPPGGKAPSVEHEASMSSTAALNLFATAMANNIAALEIVAQSSTLSESASAWPNTCSSAGSMM